MSRPQSGRPRRINLKSDIKYLDQDKKMVTAIMMAAIGLRTVLRSAKKMEEAPCP